MKRIELRGVIVSGNYDGDWADQYIQRGIFTPESRVRKAFAEADDDVELYVNSQGGSVFAGNEIVNVIQAFRATGRKVEITVGALAASMAAIIVANADASNVKVHQNSRIMFHGALMLTEGGAGAHEDSASLLASFNQQVIDKLTGKNPDMADEIKGWFEEGRAGWLSAHQAVDMGIAGSIIGEDAGAAPKVSEEAAQAMLDNGGMDIAAFDFDAATPDAEAGDTHEEPHNVASFVPLAEYEVLKARYAGMQSAKDKEIAALKSEYGARESEHIAAMSAAQKKIEEFTAQTESYKSEIAKAEADVIAAKSESEKALADLAAEGERRKTAEARHAALVGGVLRAEDGEADNLTWPDVSQRLGYAEAKKRYPELYAQYGEQVKSKGKTK
jgi:ATP-dependent protease ClpP protease subunit